MSQSPRQQGSKPRRALADGPAFQAAMAELEDESSRGWKLLDGPPTANPKPTAISGQRPVVNPPPPPRRDLNRTQVMPKPVEAVPKPPEPPADEFANKVMAAFAETVPREPQPSAPVVLEEPVVAESATAPIAEVPLVSDDRIGAPSALMTVPVEQSLVPPRPVRRKWVIAVAVGGLVGGLLVGLAALGVLMLRTTAEDVPSAPKAVQAKAAPALAPEPAPIPEAEVPTVQPETRDGPGVVPWADQPQADSGSCQELAGAAPGSLTVELAIKNAHRAMMRGDAKAAHEAFCVATEKGAQTQTVLMGHAHALLMQSDYAAALQVVDRELQLRPSPAARLLRGDVLIRTGDVQEAKQAWLSAIGVPHDSEPLVKNLRRGYEAESEAALHAGDLARADRSLRRVMALGSPDRVSCQKLANTLEKRGHSEAAERWRAHARGL